MAYEVLARKWRPQVFEDVVGQEHVTQTLANAVRSDRLAHAYLFAGPRGVGKTSVARILAKTINCENGKPGIPCNQCSSCEEITTGSSVDVQEIDGASNRGIDEIRELRENIKYMPSSSQYRIYVIDEVHMLTKEAFNALLKTLEEPPPHVKFIFATTEAHKVPVTILSRCQRFDFKRIPSADVVRQLENIALREEIEISKSGLTLIAREAEGSLRDAESLLDQLTSFTGTRVEDQHISEVLGIIDTSVLFEAARAILEGSAKRCLELADQIFNQGYDIKEFYRALMSQFRDLLVCRHGSADALLEETSGSELEQTKQLAQATTPEKLHALLNFLINREERLRFSSHPRLILETTMVTLCQMGAYLSFSELLEKIESLERRLASPAPPAGEAPAQSHGTPPRTNPPSGHTGQAPRAGDWEEFLGFLSSKSKPMYNVLRNWVFLRFSDTDLVIGKANRSSFSANFFNEPERFEQLTAYCREFFQRDIRVKIVDAPHVQEQTEGNDEVPPAPAAEGPERGNSELPPPVQDILHIFQGEIEPDPDGENKKQEEVES